ncbi:hypothetical protein ACQ5SP_15920 [Rhodovulum sp. YNF3179]|uniref:hypothetical protein n=1 Tax=Rhodovulum sp. YNF3179 TaxID=3425127 RepID=UPI003D351D80
MALKKQNLTDADLKFIRKFACELDGCDENFVFKTTVEKLGAAGGAAKTYQAVCTSCQKKTLMMQANMEKWQTLFTGGEFDIGETTYSKFFE